MLPVLSDRGKNVLLYGGISALGGYEVLNKDKRLLPDGATLLDRSRFVYGGAVHGSVEVFLTDRILFLVKAQGPFPLWNGRASFPSGCFCRTKI